MASHAMLSPSGAERWMSCAGSAALEAHEPDQSSEYADEGTAAHFLASECLTSGDHPTTHIGKKIAVWTHPESDSGGADWLDALQTVAHELSINEFTVDTDMAAFVNRFIRDVLDYKGDGELLVEQSLPIGHITGEEGAKGTGDAIVLRDDEIQVHDLKFGRGVEVSAERNKQLMLYGLGALEQYGMMGDFTRVRLVIHQVRLSGPSEWDISVADLLHWAETEAKPAAERCMRALAYRDKWDELHEKYLAPSEDACRFCKAKATCPALQQAVLNAVADDFVDLTQPDQAVAKIEVAIERDMDNAQLSTLMRMVGMIEDWCKALRGRTETELLAGREVPGYKLVEGRQGNRQWTSAEEAEATLKSMRLKQEEMYNFSLISPTDAEKLAKDGRIGQRQWPKLQPLITRTSGKPSVAPVTDKRPPLDIKAVVDDFTDLTAEDLV